MNDKKKQNLDFFNRELSNYLLNPLTKHKFLVIHDEKLIAAYDTFETALQFAASNLPHDEFVIQQALDESKVINFHAIAG